MSSSKKSTSKNQRTSKKQEVFKEKRVRERNPILLFPASVNEVVDGKVNGYEFIQEIKKFGKKYLQCKRG